jgi:hypothetical protein
VFRRACGDGSKEAPVDILKVPVAAADMTIGRALQRMRKDKVSGIAQLRKRYVAVFSYGDLLEHKGHPSMLLSRVDAYRLAMIVPEDEATTHNLPPSPGPLLSVEEQDAIESFMRVRGFFYAVFGTVKKQAILASMSEDGMTPYNATPSDCRCQDQYTRHCYPPSHPPTCHYDGSVIKCER